MGGSGMGKTTLLKTHRRPFNAPEGTVTFAGQKVDTSDSAALYKIRRSMGMLFQFGALFTDMTVFDNVAFLLENKPIFPKNLFARWF